MKIKAILPYYGGKRTLAQTIVDMIGDHKVYWEPFCGGMSVILSKPPCELETVNDLHGDLINLAMVIKDEELCFELYERLARTLYCEAIFNDSMKRWMSLPQKFEASKPDIDRAYDYFVISWVGINGVSGTERYNYNFAMRWCIGGGQGARRWSSVIESMPAWHKRLRNVVILQRDGIETTENIKDDHHTVIYCDPPYFDKSDKYLYDFEGPEHERLAIALQRFKKAKVMVSYYDDPRLDTLYKGFEKIQVKGSRQSLRNATRGEKKKPRRCQQEVLLVNKQNPSLF